MDPKQLLSDFNRQMLVIYDASAKLDPPYRPTLLRQMVLKSGGKAAADQLLESSSTSTGFTELFTRGREALKLSVEYLVLQRPWRDLFEPEPLAIARQRLIEVGCELPPDDLVADQEPGPEPVDAPEPSPEPPSRLMEGAIHEVTLTVYERSSEARAACLAHCGPICSACGFDFGLVYGPLADGFIHVHHLKPLAEAGETREVDPVADLRPVCPNCHAFIHLGGGCRTIKEVWEMVAVASRA